MPEVSVIVPVYNAEAALQRCIDSILNQEYKDLELILVNDGSRDSSGSICDEAARKDSRVRVIHKTNSGVSDTRNMGIDEAEGTFIQFLDADDWITSDSTKLLVRTAKEKNADLVIGDFYRVVGDNLATKGSIETDEVLSLQEYAEYLKASPADYYYGVIWNKLYRRDIMNKYHVRMQKDVSFCEDFIFNLEYLLHCERIAALLVPVYYYVKTDGSLVSASMNPKKIIDMKTSVYQYYDKFFRNVLDEEKYRNERVKIASFMVSAATDEFVIPLAPGTKKVGEEKTAVVFNQEDTIIAQTYYLKKLFEKYLNTVAVKNDLEPADVRLFGYVKAQKEVHSLREIMDVTGLSEAAIIGSAQRLMMRGYISLSIHKNGIRMSVKKADSLEHDLDLVKEDLMESCFSGFSEEEKKQATGYLSRIGANVKERLK